MSRGFVVTVTVLVFLWGAVMAGALLWKSPGSEPAPSQLGTPDRALPVIPPAREHDGIEPLEG